MKTYIALFQGPNAREARPLLATSDKEVVRRLTDLLRDRLPGATEKKGRPDNSAEAQLDRTGEIPGRDESANDRDRSEKGREPDD